MSDERKKQMRALIRKTTGRLERAEIEIMSSQAEQKIESMVRFATADVIGGYSALADEISITGILQRWHCRKTVALPVIEGGIMVFREYTGEANLNPGPFGIREPQRGRLILPEEIELMLVPGMAFDSDGYRLGRGRGYYDKYFALPGADKIYKIGICMPHQIMEYVPHEPHDIPMDEILHI